MEIKMPTEKETKLVETHRLKILEAFSKALKYAVVDEHYGDDTALQLQNEAFAVAKKYGWDDQDDQEFSHWCLKATDVEILAFGLAHAIQRCK